MKYASIVGFICIFAIAIWARFTGPNWDGGMHLHPDERFLTMVTNNLNWPTNINEYFDTDHSPLNPHNKGFNFYVYGTWPIILTKLIAGALQKDTYDLLPHIGRTLSALADLVTLLFVFLIAKHLASSLSSKPSLLSALLAMFIYAISVLPIQLSHFFAVDTFAVMGITIVLYLLVTHRLGFALGVAMAIALSAKVSAVLLFPTIGLAYITAWPWRAAPGVWKKRFILLGQWVLFILFLLLTVRIIFPYLFTGMKLNPKVLTNWQELKGFDGDQTGFPPALQWIGTVPILYPLVDIIIWGLGLPLGIITMISILYIIFQLIVGIRRTSASYHRNVFLLLIWIFTVFIYQSIQFAKPLRYMAPLYPALAILTGLFLSKLFHFFASHFRHKFIGQLVNWSIGFMFVVWPLSFLSIYSHPPTRVSASEWIYTHIPYQSTLAWETWDDPLPLGMGEHHIGQYQTIPLPMYDPDSEIKWRKLAENLATTDYLILSSDRVYGGLERAKKRYPTSFRYYQLLFNGTLGFIPTVTFTNRPTLPLPFLSLCVIPSTHLYGSLALPSVQCNTKGLTIVDDFAEESYTVYDHPKVLIFKNSHQFNADELYAHIYER